MGNCFLFVFLCFESLLEISFGFKLWVKSTFSILNMDVMRMQIVKIFYFLDYSDG